MIINLSDTNDAFMSDVCGFKLQKKQFKYIYIINAYVPCMYICMYVCMYKYVYRESTKWVSELFRESVSRKEGRKEGEVI